MIRKVCLTATLVVVSLLATAAAAFAGDPSQVGQHLENIISPNAHSLWRIGAFVAALVTIFGRLKGSVLFSLWAGVAFAGMVIFNPGGFTNMVNNLGEKIL